MAYCDCLEYKVLPSCKGWVQTNEKCKSSSYDALLGVPYAHRAKTRIKKTKKRFNLFTYAQDEGKIPLRKSCGLKWVNKQLNTKRSIIFKLDFSLFGTTNVA